MSTKKVNEKFKSNVLLILLKMCTSLLECIMLLEEDFKCLSFEKVSVGSGNSKEKARDKLENELYKKIGKLQVELDWLKKKSETWM